MALIKSFWSIFKRIIKNLLTDNSTPYLFEKKNTILFHTTNLIFPDLWYRFLVMEVRIFNLNFKTELENAIIYIKSIKWNKVIILCLICDINLLQKKYCQTGYYRVPPAPPKANAASRCGPCETGWCHFVTNDIRSSHVQLLLLCYVIIQFFPVISHKLLSML